MAEYISLFILAANCFAYIFVRVFVALGNIRKNKKRLLKSDKITVMCTAIILCIIVLLL